MKDREAYLLLTNGKSDESDELDEDVKLELIKERYWYIYIG